MSTQKALEDLIDAAWQVIESDFDPDAFMTWRNCARDCVVTLMGSDHPYAQFFEALVAKKEAKTNLLAVAGILEATKEQVATSQIPADRLTSEQSTLCMRDTARV